MSKNRIIVCRTRRAKPSAWAKARRKYPSAKAWFDRANAALGYDLTAICFNGPEAELTKT